MGDWEATQIGVRFVAELKCKETYGVCIRNGRDMPAVHRLLVQQCVGSCLLLIVETSKKLPVLLYLVLANIIIMLAIRQCCVQCLVVLIND